MSTPNTLTGLIPTLYESLNIVSREMVGFIPAVRRDTSAERAAKDQTVRVPLADVGALEAITPGQMPADTGNATIGYTDITIDKSFAVPILWNGEQERALQTGGQYSNVLRDQFAEAMRKLVNEVEIDLAIRAKTSASRAYAVGGTPTTPFATAANMSALAATAGMLEANGAPSTDLQFVMNSLSMANLRGLQSNLFKVNEAGSSDMLRNGMTDRLMGFALRQSAGIKAHVQGAAASYVTDGAAAVGATGITVKTGSAAINAGSLFSIADAEPNANEFYVAAAGRTGAGVLSINKPGLLIAAADAKAITVKGAYTGNFAFDRNAMVLVTRAPAVPGGGDSADDSTLITDPVSGLTFEVRVYRQYRQVKYEVCLAWGTAAINNQHIVTLAGA